MISFINKPKGCRPIGIDIGNHSVKMLQLAVNGGHTQVIAASETAVDPSINGDAAGRKEFVAGAVKRMLCEGGFAGSKVVSCLPNDHVGITSLRLDAGQVQDIDDVVRREARQRFGLDVETDSVDYIPAGSVRQAEETKEELILFGAESQVVKAHIEMLEEAGLSPSGIDTVPGALFRAFERSLRRYEDRDRTIAFVDLGSKYTTVVFGRQDQINLIKKISLGGDKFNEEIAQRLSINKSEAQTLRESLRKQRNGAEEDGLDAGTRQAIVDAIGGVSDELAREIALCFKYYTVTFKGRQVERAVFCGGEAYETILINALNRQLSVEIEIGQPLKGFDLTQTEFGSDRRAVLCEWTVATGLSLKGLKEKVGS
jgi:type IV pilus assembly protein PilM